MILWGVPYRLIIIGFVINSVLCNKAPNINPGPDATDNCYAIAVYNELMKAIEIIKAQTAKSSHQVGGHPSRIKRQDDDEEGGILDVEVPSIVPQFFNVVGQAFTFNRTAVAEGIIEVIPAGLGNRLSAVLGGWANNILGSPVIPTTTRSPPKKRRRTTTTKEPQNSTTTASTTPEPTTEKASTTPEVLFKAGSLGELPVYASAYAPNYVATTTFPVYANRFLHILHPAPTTTTTPPTTTPTTTPSTTTDPNSYNVELPFDYLEITTSASSELNAYIAGKGNVTLTGTTPEYEEYEYEDVTEEITTSTEFSRSRADSDFEVFSTSKPSTIPLPLNSSIPSLTTPSPGSSTTITTEGGNKTKVDFSEFDFMQYSILKDLYTIFSVLYKNY